MTGYDTSCVTMEVHAKTYIEDCFKCCRLGKGGSEWRRCNTNIRLPARPSWSNPPKVQRHASEWTRRPVWSHRLPSLLDGSDASQVAAVTEVLQAVSS